MNPKLLWDGNDMFMISPSADIGISPVWCSRLRPTTGVHLAPCHDEFRGSRSEYVRQVALETTADFLVINFDFPTPRMAVDLLRPGPEMSLNRHCVVGWITVTWIKKLLLIGTYVCGKDIL
ncbi:hypothetical protein TNCV_1136381 [Trichonephila clavipes]|nr:hypothetical protein TNCV_1136381 [Trichonephila clavipes]